MQQVILSKTHVRNLVLHAAGLHRQATFGTGPEAVYNVIDHLGYVQIDTNYVVERAHHHALAVRVPGYKPEWLAELQADGRLFEYFMADSGYMPMHDYRFSLPVKESFRQHRKPLPPADTNLMAKVLDRIAREGPLMVKDFDNDRPTASTGWWDWRPSKLALERLYQNGELMITRGRDFNKIYDLPMNLLPTGLNTTPPTPEEFARHVINRTLQCLGIAYAKEVAWRARYAKNNLVKKMLEQMLAQGELCTVKVEGLKTATLYMLPGYGSREVLLREDAIILSPFDTLNVFRHRLRDFFGFDYQIECFVPAPKRKYGYFSLPVLLGDTFIARMDAKAQRAQRVLAIHNLHFENDAALTANTEDKLLEAIKKFVAFNHCQMVTLERTNHPRMHKILKDITAV